MDKTKPFGLVLPKRTQKFPVKTNVVFGSDSDDEPPKKKSSVRIPQAKPLSKKILKVEQCEDPSMYEYDSIYDDMKAKEVAKIAPKTDKPSRYIDSLLKAADKRKKNYERRLEKKVQAERVQEGDKFKDKEAFVTSAYKKKMQEMEEEEERERRESQLNDMMDVTKQKDLSGFYRHFLKQSIGEEKIPIFGDRIDIKQEPGTEEDSKEADKAVEDSTAKDIALDPDLDRDSDIVSSSDEEAIDQRKDLSNSEEKAEKSPRNSNSDDNLTSKEPESKRKKTKSHRQLRKRFDDSDDENEAKSESAEVVRPQNPSKRGEDNSDSFKNKTIKKSHRKELNNTENFDSDSSKSSNKDDRDSDIETNDSAELTGLTKENDGHDAEIKKTEERRNVFEKRTVGDVFADAQARYFQRMATRTA